METTLTVLIGLSLPPLGTTLGATAVYFRRGGASPPLRRMLSAFASGVMIAAAIWSLLLPAMALAEQNGTPPQFPAVGGLLGGVLLLLCDTL